MASRKGVARELNVQGACMFLVRDVGMVIYENESLMVNSDPLMTATKQARHVTQEVHNNVDFGFTHGTNEVNNVDCGLGTAMYRGVDMLITIPR